MITTEKQNTENLETILEDTLESTANTSANDDQDERDAMLEEANAHAEKEAKADFRVLFAKIKQLETQLQEKEEIAKNSQIAYLHLKSDFDLLQRQTGQKIENANRDATLAVAKKILPQLENLRKSLLNLTPEQQESAMGKGLLMMQEGFIKALESLHIVPIEAVGLEPNPQFHEPVSMQAVEDAAFKGKIVQEFEQGFLYQKGDEQIVLNPAKVVVGS